MASGNRGYADGWIDSLKQLHDIMEQEGMLNKAFNDIYEHLCDHYDQLGGWEQDGKTTDPPDLPPYR